ncbi:arsenate reductase (glutaredoxin) [Pontibacter sp. E15-1]|uniref:arsenate reductase (glutaredoxin) n=1 Tax=Pontibacter sp. E15-1 TaxID=2919918 RepID=UPI001F4F4F4B|nr:arsenate reductase (glutaredoxin) [Pontibacter sp. E15-1]MCJ8167089.1 arsenate reductase (glutaredoxin) [Pontibacter sp. E15-1]
MLKIYHNPRCSKSRQTLDLIKEAAQEVEVIEYLKNPPTAADLKDVLNKLGIPAEQLLRKGEPLYKDNHKGKSRSDDEWVQIMVENPVLIERPIVMTETKAILGRPPENVMSLLKPRT